MPITALTIQCECVCNYPKWQLNLFPSKASHGLHIYSFVDDDVSTVCRDSEEEISALKRRVEELESKIESENRRCNNMNDTIENLQGALRSAERRVGKMEKNKEDLEQQVTL